MLTSSVMVRQFIIENFLFEESSILKEDTSFLESGIIDSTGVLELVTFLEEKFRIKIEDDELVPENLDCIANVVSFLGKKLSISDSVS